MLTSRVIQLPVMPARKEKWEEYFLEIYDTTLSSMLDKQKSSYNAEQCRTLKKCNKEVVNLYLTKLRNILGSTSMTQEEISKGLEPCDSRILSLIRGGLQKTV